jgi:hypothetical protein
MSVANITKALDEAAEWNEAAIAIARHGVRAGVPPKDIIRCLVGMDAMDWPHWPEDTDTIVEIVLGAHNTYGK